MRHSMVNVVVLAFLMAVAVCSADSQSDLPSIGFLGIVNEEGFSREDAVYLTDLLYGYAVSYGAESYKVIDRESIERTLVENQLDVPYICAESSCACSLGELLDADYMVTGTLGVVRKSLWCSSNVLQLDKICVETGESELQLSITARRTGGWNKRANIRLLEEELKFQSKVLFISNEQRESNYRSPLARARTTLAIGLPLTVAGAIGTGIAAGAFGFYMLEAMLVSVISLGTEQPTFEDSGLEKYAIHAIWGIPCLVAGRILLEISSTRRSEAKFWKSTLPDN